MMAALTSWNESTIRSSARPSLGSGTFFKKSLVGGLTRPKTVTRRSLSGSLGFGMSAVFYKKTFTSVNAFK